MGKSDTICWRCKNSTGKCCWSRNFMAVPGWNAQPTLIKNYTVNGDVIFDNSYIVHKCPLFEHDGLESCEEMAKRLGLDKTSMMRKIKIMRGSQDEDLL